MAKRFYENSDSQPVRQYKEIPDTGFVLVTDAVQLEELYNELVHNLFHEGTHCLVELKADWHQKKDEATWSEVEYFALLDHLKDVMSWMHLGMMDKSKDINSNLSYVGKYDAAMQTEINQHLDDHINQAF